MTIVFYRGGGRGIYGSCENAKAYLINGRPQMHRYNIYCRSIFSPHLLGLSDHSTDVAYVTFGFLAQLIVFLILTTQLYSGSYNYNAIVFVS